MDQWKGKVVVVTGVSSGIGEAIARELVKYGMKVAGLARRVERVDAISKDLKSSPGTLQPIKCDVTKEGDVKAAFAWVEKNWGPVHAVINNAGVFSIMPMESVDTGASENMFKTNVIGPMACMREGVAAMKKHKVDGVIINVNSVAGHTVMMFPGVGPYSATKHSLRVLTDYLRNEIYAAGLRIRVTNLSPGLVESEISDQFKDKLTPATPILKAKDIADCVVFVLSAPPRMNVDELKVRPTGECEVEMMSVLGGK